MSFDWLTRLDLPPLVILTTLTGLIGLGLGWLVRGAGRGSAQGRSGQTEPSEEEAQDQRDMKRNVYLLQNENKHMSTFLMSLPDLARQLNTNHEKRRIPPLLLTFADQIFEAEQILIFDAGLDGKHLVLSVAKGISEDKRARDSVPFGEGRLGFVARHQVTMDDSDFTQKADSMRADFKDKPHPLFRPDLCAPIVSDGKTLGVISVGGVRKRPRNEKHMLKMVADLGSIAIQNTILFTAIQESANCDGLTGLRNKRHFMDRLSEEILKAQKSQTSLSLFLFDIDHFKNYNDTNGHLAGDDALRITGRLLRAAVRLDDTPARYGGEEFAVLLPNTDKQGAIIAAEKIRKMLEEHAYPSEETQPLGRVTISGGVATCPGDASSAADLIRCADQALYQCKKAGRNRVMAHKPVFLSDETDVNIALPPLADRQKM